MFFGSKKVIGLDIGTSSIKVAEIEMSRKQIQLISFGFAPTPVGSINSGEINNPNAVGVAVQSLLMEMKSKRKYAVTGMWGTSVIVKKITIPKVEKKLIADQIKWEAEQYIPFDINSISLAYHIIGSTSSAETMDVLLIAAQSELVAQQAAAIQSAGLEVAVIDVSGFALANTFEANYGKVREESIALLNIGAGVTNFVVVSQGDVVFSRDIPVGGFSYTNEIHKELGITIPEAEALKISAVQKQEVPAEVHNVINSTNDVITEEIRNSFEFFAASNVGLTLSRCFITGGSSVVTGLSDQIGKAAGLSVSTLNPFNRVQTNSRNFSKEYLQQISPFASVVLGLAMRKVGD